MRAPFEAGVDRLSPRARPDGNPILHQNWENLFFIHWPVDEKWLRPLIPPIFDIDTFGGSAWVGITPFTVNKFRGLGLPQIPGFNSFHEINLRTYVVYRGLPGVWFLSLDASKPWAVLSAKIFYSLPYRSADIQAHWAGGNLSYQMRRLETPDAFFEISAKPGEILPDAPESTFPFFFAERYVLFTVAENLVCRARIYHSPWVLQSAELHLLKTNLFEGTQLAAPQEQPMIHYSHRKEVEIWPLEKSNS